MAKKTFQDYGREWLDTLVVAISVAMAFRAYFYEPFKIPTFSPQKANFTQESGNLSQAVFSTFAWVWCPHSVSCMEPVGILNGS